MIKFGMSDDFKKLSKKERRTFLLKQVWQGMNPKSLPIGKWIALNSVLPLVILMIAKVAGMT